MVVASHGSVTYTRQDAHTLICVPVLMHSTGRPSVRYGLALPCYLTLVLETTVASNVPLPSIALVSAPVLVLERSMSTRSASHRDHCASDSESSYFAGSYNSSTETNSDVPGPGRLLGKVYSFLGKKAENALSVVAVKVGRGPRETATKIRQLIRESTLIKPPNRKKLKKAGKRLAKYIR